VRSTFFPYRQHFVDRSTGAAIGSTKCWFAASGHEKDAKAAA